MTRRFALSCGLVLLSACLGSSAQNLSSAAYDSVDPIIGTSGDGNTFPGASLPFGMVQWSPDTNANAWYAYNDKSITGLTHLSGAGCPLYGDFGVLPTASAGDKWAVRSAALDHSREEAHPGFYAMTLADGIRVEITVTERAGIARFTYPEGSRAQLLVNADSSANLAAKDHDSRPDHQAYRDAIELKGKSAFAGSVTAGGFCGSPTNYKLFVAGEFVQPFASAELRQGDTSANGSSAEGTHTGAWFDFGKSRQVILKIGLSYVSEANALENLDKEIPGSDFDQVRKQAEHTWSSLLDRIAVEGGSSEQRKIFYTGLYHSLLAPTLFSDVNGQYMGFDEKAHSLAGAKQKAQYANFSDWDIYRNTVQLQALLEPGRESDMMQSLVNDAEQSGWYPRWPAAHDTTYVMGGDSPVILLASSYAFGARDFDTATALKFMRKAGSEPGKGPHGDSERPYLADYRKLGYVPATDAIDCSRTLEYANADFAIAQFAKAVGDQGTYQAFLKQSANWKNLFDPETRWIRPRNADGTWLAGFDADRSQPKRPDAPVSTDQYGFEEGNTYQYTFMLPFDYPALFAAIGGDAQVEPRLDKFFSKLICWGEPCFNMANEPDFVTPYAYVFAGIPWKTQDVVTRIEKETFKTTPDGIPGNDDLGATSGVYVWNALGFYPAVPGVGGVVFGTPMFEKATLHLAGQRTVVIHRSGNGVYVANLQLNGKEYANSWLPLDKLRGGTTEIHFTMSEQPNKERGKAIADRPPVFR